MKPHTVILGAGATMAAIPNGDKNGKESSVMKGLIDKLNMREVIDGIELHTKSDNPEDIYSELYLREDCEKERIELEKRIYDYFSELELPEEPTFYDLLILSLTRNDTISTFNWDPLLLQAYARCLRYTNNLPHIFCLHGNVAMGYCEEHREFGMTGTICPVCRKLFSPTKLLYPVGEKDYNSDDYIKRCWEATEYMIEQSYMITIFGYSAPSSDKKAVALLKKAWGELEKRQLEEVSVIGTSSEEVMLERWKDFIYTHHYNYTHTFYDSYLGMFPRRSCETVFATFMLNVFPDNTKGFRPGMTWDDVERILDELLREEINTPHRKNYPLHYTHPRFHHHS